MGIDMKIADVRVYVLDAEWKQWVIAVVETSDGIVGVGEGTLDYRGPSVATAVSSAAEYLIGKSPFGVERHRAALYEGYFWRGGPAEMCALSALDQSLWDIAGKAMGAPVHRLLGGPYRDRIPVYLNQWYRGAESLEGLVEKAQQAVAAGSTGLKWYPFRFLPQLEQSYVLTPADMRRAVDEVGAIRRAVGPDIDLMVDVWRRLDLMSAAQFCHAIEEFNLLFVEEPVAAENPEILCELSRRTRVRLAAGERLIGRSDFLRIIERQAVGILQPSILRVGGLTEARKIASMAETYVIGVAPHNPYGPIACAAAIQLSATIPNFVSLETYANHVPAIRDEIFTRQPEITGSYYPVVDTPGLGVEIDENKVARLALSAWGYRKNAEKRAKSMGGAAWIEKMTPTLTKS